jgi:hypothetical protein|tara:strand:+ start:392 stop:1042 length:651 start_codon:yes stop_codon:yes gene_type:complete
MGQNSTEVAYGFGQMGSIHGKVAKPLIPPKGMVIVAVQFLARNTPVKIVSESRGVNGHGSNYVDTETIASMNFEGVTFDVDSTESAATFLKGADVTIAANPKVKVGQYVLLVNDADTQLLGITIDSTTKVPNYAKGFEQGTKVATVNAAGTTLTLTEDITVANNVQHLVFIDEHNGAGGQDASGVTYPTGMIIYGRWTEFTPEADTNGGVIAYFGY